MTKIFLCGNEESTGRQTSKAEIEKIKTRLSAMQCKVYNPFEMNFKRMNWSNSLQKQIKLLRKCQVVYILPDWKDSIMARIMVTTALDLRKITIYHPLSNQNLISILTTLDS